MNGMIGQRGERLCPLFPPCRQRRAIDRISTSPVVLVEISTDREKLTYFVVSFEMASHVSWWKYQLTIIYCCVIRNGFACSPVKIFICRWRLRSSDVIRLLLRHKSWKCCLSVLKLKHLLSVSAGRWFVVLQI